MDPFQHKAVFDIVYGKVVSVEMATSDPSESSGGYIYPRCTFITTLLLNLAPWLLHQSLTSNYLNDGAHIPRRYLSRSGRSDGARMSTEE
jgi:hypothetical protein